MRYLEAAGFAPKLSVCSSCGKEPEAPETWNWSFQAPAAFCPDCSKKVRLSHSPVPGELLVKLHHLPRPYSPLSAPLAASDLALAEGFFEALAVRAAGRTFKSPGVIKSYLKGGLN